MRLTIRTSPLEVDIPGVGEALPVFHLIMSDDLALITLEDGRFVKVCGDRFLVEAAV